MKFPKLIPPGALALVGAISLLPLACTDDGGDPMETDTVNDDATDTTQDDTTTDGGEDTTTDGGEDTTTTDTGSTDTGTGDTTTDDGGGCFEAPPECLAFVECASAILPDQYDAINGQLGAEGSCWCGSEPDAVECWETCVAQLELAIEANPTEPLCHGQYCPIEELEEGQPYGPIEDGACPDYNGAPQEPIENPLGVPGGYCAPACSGIANYCADHSQTIAEGTCYLTLGDTNYCISRCYVDPFALGATGTQCQCGARCQPQGAPDGEGNMRGICTYE